MLSLTPASISSDSSAMWGHILLIFLAGLPLFSAAPQVSKKILNLCFLEVEIFQGSILFRKRYLYS